MIVENVYKTSPSSQICLMRNPSSQIVKESSYLDFRIVQKESYNIEHELEEL